MSEQDEVSEEEAIRRAKEELGEETIAKLQGLPPEIRAAILKSIQEESPKARHPGGRPPGSGKMDLSPAFQRMAELQEQEPGLKDRPASRRVAEEMAASGLHVAADTIRREYRPRREELRAAIRQQKRQSPKVQPPAPTAVNAAALGLARNVLSPAYLAEITGMSVNVKDARRALEESLLAGITPQSAWAKDIYQIHQAAAAAMGSTVDTAAEQWSALRASGALLTAEETMRQITGSASDDALRGLAFLLGKKPTE
jgi:hypothetical protein